MPELKDFKVGGHYGGLYHASLGGSGRDAKGTVYRMPAHASTQKKQASTKKGTTNPLYLMKFDGKVGVKVRAFSLVGTAQGHLYGGLRVDKSDTPELYELRVVDIPGNSDVPPGETFGINLWRCSDVNVHDVEIDGGGVGASGLGLNTCTAGQVESLTTHDHKYCKGVALWEHDAGMLFDRVQSLSNAFAYGFERCDGLYVLRRNKFRGSRRADIHLANDGGQWGRAKLRIEDPDLERGQRIKVLLSKEEMGRKNVQVQSDVTVTVDGKVRNDLLQFVTKA